MGGIQLRAEIHYAILASIDYHIWQFETYTADKALMKHFLGFTRENSWGGCPVCWVCYDYPVTIPKGHSPTIDHAVRCVDCPLSSLTANNNRDLFKACKTHGNFSMYPSEEKKEEYISWLKELRVKAEKQKSSLFPKER